MRLKDQNEAEYCLGPVSIGSSSNVCMINIATFCPLQTHEEPITQLVAGEQLTYRQLPLRVYQVRTNLKLACADCLHLERDGWVEESYVQVRAIINTAYTCTCTDRFHLEREGVGWGSMNWDQLFYVVHVKAKHSPKYQLLIDQKTFTQFKISSVYMQVQSVLRGIDMYKIIGYIVSKVHL